MAKIKHFIKQSWLLIIASFFFGLLIAVANAAWSPRISQNEKDKLNNLMQTLVSSADSFQLAITQLPVPAKKGKVILTDIHKALDSKNKIAGFAFIAAGSGFADKIKLVIAVDAKCEKLLGYKVLSSNETPGFGDKIKEKFLQDQFILAPAAKVLLAKTGDPATIDSEIIAISGATVSSEAVTSIFNTYIETIKQSLIEKGLAEK